MRAEDTGLPLTFNQTTYPQVTPCSCHKQQLGVNMPVHKCANGKWRIGNGPCKYTTKEAAVRAYQAYLAKTDKGKKQ